MGEINQLHIRYFTYIKLDIDFPSEDMILFNSEIKLKVEYIEIIDALLFLDAIIVYVSSISIFFRDDFNITVLSSQNC